MAGPARGPTAAQADHKAFGRRLDARARRGLDHVALTQPVKKLRQVRQRAVRQHRAIHRDVFDKFADMAAFEIVNDAPPPDRQHDLVKYVLGLLPRISPCLALGILLDELVHERFHRVAFAVGCSLLRLGARIELQRRRIITAFKLAQRRRSRLARCRQREVGVEGELPRRAVKAVSHRPCFTAGGLHDEIEAPAAAVGYLAADGRRLRVVDEFRGQPCHVCYPAASVGNKIGCLRLLPNVHDNARRMATEQVFLG
jgi:hypothetical protein